MDYWRGINIRLSTPDTSTNAEIKEKIIQAINNADIDVEICDVEVDDPYDEFHAKHLVELIKMSMPNCTI